MIRTQAGVGYATRRISEALTNIDLKLLLIPILFILLRIWVVIRYFIGINPECVRPRINAYNHTLMCGFCITNNGTCGVFYNDVLVGVHVSAYLSALYLVLLLIMSNHRLSMRSGSNLIMVYQWEVVVLNI